MSEHIFPKGHYSTGTRLGIEGEFSDFGLIAAELDLTLPVVEEASPGVQFSLDELVTYHSLQYGQNPVSTIVALHLIGSREYLGSFKPEDVLEKTSELPDRIERMTSKERLSLPVPLGRIAVGYEAEVSDELRDFTRVLSFMSGPNGRRSGRFLYPRGGVSLSYAGKHEQTEELEQFLNQQRKVDPMAHSLELDDIVAEREDGKTQGFVAISNSLGLKKIVSRSK